MMNITSLNFFRWRSLKTRVTVFTLVIFLLGIWSLALYASRMLQEDMQRVLGEQQFSMVNIIAAELNDDLDERLRALEKMAGGVTPAMLANTAALQKFLNAHPVFQDMFNAGTFATRIDGTAVADGSLSVRRIGINFMDRAFIASALKEGKATISGPIVGKKLQTPIIGMAVSIRDTQGKVIGALMGVTNLGIPNFLDKVTTNRYSMTGGYLLAAPQHKLVVTATDKSRIMQPLPAPGMSPMHDRYRQGFDGFGIAVNLHGTEELSAAQHIPVADWYIEATLPTAEAFAPIRAMQQRMQLAAIFLTLLAGGLTWWMLRHQLSPMLAAAKILADLSDTTQPLQPLPITRQDEIGELITGFNRLMATLVRRKIELRMSTERLNEAQHIAHLGSWTLDLISGELIWSDETFRLFEIDPQQSAPSYEAFLDAIHPDDRDAVNQAYASSLHTRMPYEITHRLLMSDGRVKWMHEKCWSIFDAAGKPLLSQGTVQDITERKVTELELEHHRNHLEELVKEQTDELRTCAEATKRALTDIEQQKFVLDRHAIVSVTDSKGRINYANDKISQISGYSNEELMGQDHQILNSGHHPKGFFKVMYETIARGEVWHGEVCNRAQNGHLYWVDTTIAAFTGEDGKLQRYIAVCTDITERKRAEDAAHAANRAKSEFLANMSHEIRTPMNGVVGMIDILQETELKPEQHRMLATIHHSSLALLQILNDILDYSKIEAGKLTIENIPTHLREVAEGAAQLMVAIANSKSIELTLFVSPELPRLIVGDPTRLRQVLLNLLGNAVKFTTHQQGRPGLVMLRVEPCTLADGRPGLQLRIIDTGIGMNPELLAKLFQPFTQADEGTARKFGGTGLGLSISQRLVEMMGGRISVRSTVGEGSEFTVELPLQEAAPDRALATEPSLAGVHVLAVTCDAVAVQILPAYCIAAGAKITVVADLAAARQQLQQQSSGPTVVLLGIAITTASNELDLPAGTSVVRLVQRSSRASFSEIMIFARPLLYHDLIYGLALASGRWSLSGIADQTESCLRPNTRNLSIEEAACTGRLILFAEDNETNREVTQEQLRMLGYNAEVAEDGVVALKMWRSGRYALLLTDCHMPNMDGFELTAAIREAEPEGTHLPIIAVTANAMQGEAQRCLEHGMDDYLPKPLRLKELGSMLLKWLPLPAKMTEEIQGAAPDKAGELFVSNKINDAIESMTDKNKAVEEAPIDRPAVWDATMLTRMVGDNPAMHRRLLDKFLHIAEKQVVAIGIAAAGDEAGVVADVAHQLKSAARTVGAMQLGELCQELETAGRSGDVQTGRALAKRLDKEFSAAAEKIGKDQPA